jgi:methylenetetrahydrofolate dehydrogenase (NADP+)/methenyltetrahydrofolate cyclohydrolase
MTAQIIDGKAIAQKIIDDLKQQVAELAACNCRPHLVAIQVGDDPATAVYLKSQKKHCEDVGIRHSLHQLPATTRQDELLAHLTRLNADKSVTGIIIHEPLPRDIDESVLQAVIAPHKDIEGVTAVNLGFLAYGEPNLVPCTPLGIIHLMRSVGVPLRGLEVTLIGRGRVVGMPLLLLLLMESVTPTVCHRGTLDLKAHCRNADVLIAATGKPGLVTGDMVKPGAIVIDVGINRVPVLDAAGKPVLDEKGKPKMKTVGDVVFDEAKEVAGHITPVPGGVGPMTVAMLLGNTVLAAKRQCFSCGPDEKAKFREQIPE